MHILESLTEKIPTVKSCYAISLRFFNDPVARVMILKDSLEDQIFFLFKCNKKNSTLQSS